MEPSMQNQNPVQSIASQSVSTRKHIKFVYAALIITIIGAGISYYLLQKTNITVQVLDTQNAKQTEKLLPTEFRAPMEYNNTKHIVDAEIENFSINCADEPVTNESCGNVDIVLHIKGVSDKEIIKLNDVLTAGIFADKNGQPVDVRKPANRKYISPDLEYIDYISSSVTYIDKGFIGFYTAYEMYSTGAAHPARNPGSYEYATINFDGTIASRYPYAEVMPMFYKYDAKTDVNSKDLVLKHFYPNGSELLKPYIISDVGEYVDTPDCFLEGDFPHEFYPELRPNTEEVVYEVSYPYGSIGVCSGELRIGIPIADILREVPQYVPENSVLWKFKK